MHLCPQAMTNARFDASLSGEWQKGHLVLGWTHFTCTRSILIRLLPLNLYSMPYKCALCRFCQVRLPHCHILCVFHV